MEPAASHEHDSSAQVGEDWYGLTLSELQRVRSTSRSPPPSYSPAASDLSAQTCPDCQWRAGTVLALQRDLDQERAKSVSNLLVNSVPGTGAANLACWRVV